MGMQSAKSLKYGIEFTDSRPSNTAKLERSDLQSSRSGRKVEISKADTSLPGFESSADFDAAYPQSCTVVKLFYQHYLHQECM